MYNHEIPDYGDVMTVKEFKEEVECGMFGDYDGSGKPAKDGKMSHQDIKPSKIEEIPSDATHIVWFNK